MTTKETTSKFDCIIGYKNENGNIVNSHSFKNIPSKPEKVTWQCSNSGCDHDRELFNQFPEVEFNNRNISRSTKNVN